MSENKDQIGTIFFKKSLIGTGPYKKGPSFHHWLVAYLPPNQMSKSETNEMKKIERRTPSNNWILEWNHGTIHLKGTEKHVCFVCHVFEDLKFHFHCNMWLVFNKGVVWSVVFRPYWWYDISCIVLDYGMGRFGDWTFRWRQFVGESFVFRGG